MVDPHDPRLQRKNMVLGWWLFAIALMILGATVAVAFIYLAAD
jgi:cytochrome c-type biogenesis protein CcmH/NrfF